MHPKNIIKEEIIDMRNVSLEFTLQYLECDLAPDFAERNPQVDVFLDGHFYKPDGVVRVDLDCKSLSKQYKVTVNGQVHRRIGAIPNTASLALVSFAERSNEFGAVCLMDAGTSHIRLSEMAESEDKFIRDISLQIHTTQPLGQPGAPGMVEKGKLRFTLIKMDMGDIEMVEGPVPISDSVKAQAVGSQIMEYINKTIRTEQQMADAIPGTSRIRAPFDISEHGMEMTGALPLPVAAYARFETPTSNLAFWRNTFNRVMARDGRTRHDFSALDDVQKARVMSLICVYPSQWFDYISDTVERNNRHQRYVAKLKESYENFGDALFTYSGDCEDLAMAIQQVFSAFNQFKFGDQDPELRELQQIATEYIPVLSLDVVHGAKVADENAPKGAHMNDNFIPISYLRDAMRRTKAGKSIENRLPWDKPYEEYRKDLPVLVGEGTGMYEPLGYEDSLKEVRRYVYSAPSLAGFKKPIVHTAGSDSTFFLGSLMGITNYWFDRGSNVGAIFYATQSRSQPLKRGILYTDIVNESSKMAIVPHPPIPEPIMNVINEVTLLRVPPNPLVLDETKMDVNAKNEHLDELVKYVQKLGRSTENASAGRAVPVYIRPHQLNEEVVDAMRRDLRKMARVYQLSYELEHVVSDLIGYRVMFHVK